MKTSKGKADSSDPEVLAKYIDEIQLLLDEGQNQAFIIHHLVSERNLDQEMASLLYTQATFGDMDASVQMSEQERQQIQDHHQNTFTQEELNQLLLTKEVNPSIARPLAAKLLAYLQQPSITSVALTELIQSEGVSPEDAQDLERKMSAKHQHIQQKQQQSKALDKIDVEIRDKIIFWRNNAFSNVEIVQKLIDKYDVSESDAKQMVQTVHLKESGEEKAKEKEKEFANATSGQIALGFVLILIGVVGTVASEGTMFFYGAIGSGVVMIFAGFFRKTRDI